MDVHSTLFVDLKKLHKNEGVPSLSEQAKGSNFATIIRKIFVIMCAYVHVCLRVVICICVCACVCKCVLKSVGQFTIYFEATFPFLQIHLEIYFYN